MLKIFFKNKKILFLNKNYLKKNVIKLLKNKQPPVTYQPPNLFLAPFWSLHNILK